MRNFPRSFTNLTSYSNKHIKVYKIIIKTIQIFCKIQLQKIIHNNSTLVLVEKPCWLERTKTEKTNLANNKNLKQLTTPNRAWIQNRHSPTYCTIIMVTGNYNRETNKLRWIIHNSIKKETLISSRQASYGYHHIT